MKHTHTQVHAHMNPKQIFGFCNSKDGKISLSVTEYEIALFGIGYRCMSFELFM